LGSAELGDVAASVRLPLLIFPCNGNALEAIDCLGDAFELIGFIDDTPEKQGTGGYGYPVFGRDALDRWPEAMVLAVPGSPSSYRHRAAIVLELGIATERFATVVHPAATISSMARIGRNILVMAGVVITSNASIGDHVCILPNTVIHHDVTIGSWCLIGSNVTLAGGATIGENCYVGSGSSVMNGRSIGAGALVGMASTVTRDVPSGVTVKGSPAKTPHQSPRTT
jgi:sugar O-acyltransferase (sialic acid O-acetyltransferase NeuD family)